MDIVGFIQIGTSFRIIRKYQKRESPTKRRDTLVRIQKEVQELWEKEAPFGHP